MRLATPNPAVPTDVAIGRVQERLIRLSLCAQASKANTSFGILVSRYLGFVANRTVTLQHPWYDRVASALHTELGWLAADVFYVRRYRRYRACPAQAQDEASLLHGDYFAPSQRSS
jgi:hypothetical protein